MTHIKPGLKQHTINNPTRHLAISISMLFGHNEEGDMEDISYKWWHCLCGGIEVTTPLFFLISGIVNHSKFHDLRPSSFLH